MVKFLEKSIYCISVLRLNVFYFNKSGGCFNGLLFRNAPFIFGGIDVGIQLAPV